MLACNIHTYPQDGFFQRCNLEAHVAQLWPVPRPNAHHRERRKRPLDTLFTVTVSESRQRGACRVLSAAQKPNKRAGAAFSTPASPLWSRHGIPQPRPTMRHHYTSASLKPRGGQVCSPGTDSVYVHFPSGGENIHVCKLPSCFTVSPGKRCLLHRFSWAALGTAENTSPLTLLIKVSL